MLKWHQRCQDQILETQSIKEELEVQKAEVVMKDGVIKTMLDDATKRVSSTGSTDDEQRLLIASLRKNASDPQKRYDDAEGAFVNQRWMFEQTEKMKLSPPPLSNSHVQIEQLTNRANSAETALLSINARSTELEEEVKEGISCLKEYEMECDKWKRIAKRMARWYYGEEGFDCTDYKGDGTGWPEYVDDGDDEMEDHHLPSLMGGKQKTDPDVAGQHDTTTDKIRQQHQQFVADQAKPQATLRAESDEAMTTRLAQEQYRAHASSQHVETLSFGQYAEHQRVRVFSNEPSRVERVVMLNYRVAKMVNLMPWAYTRADDGIQRSYSF